MHLFANFELKVVIIHGFLLSLIVSLEIEIMHGPEQDKLRPTLIGSDLDNLEIIVLRL